MACLEDDAPLSILRPGWLSRQNGAVNFVRFILSSICINQDAPPPLEGAEACFGLS